MPIYEYKCAECNHVQDEQRKIDQRHYDGTCSICLHLTKFIVSAPAGIGSGTANGYKHKTGSTGVWKEDKGPNGKLGKEWYGDNPHAPSTLNK